MFTDVKESPKATFTVKGEPFKVMEVIKLDHEPTFYNECIAACPVCITNSCTMNQGHYSNHRCREGHSW